MTSALCRCGHTVGDHTHAAVVGTVPDSYCVRLCGCEAWAPVGGSSTAPASQAFGHRLGHLPLATVLALTATLDTIEAQTPSATEALGALRAQLRPEMPTVTIEAPPDLGWLAPRGPLNRHQRRAAAARARHGRR